MSKPDNIQIYDENAKRLAERYAAMTTETELAPFVYLFNHYRGTEHKALDIGSGAGRDAFWMATRGWNVDAIDGSHGLLEEARRLNSHKNIHFMHDLAPDFKNTRDLDRYYDVILMSAFIFHFDRPERESVLKACLNLLAPAGLVYITLRIGPPSLDRNIYDVLPQEFENFAKDHNLSFKYHGREKDSARDHMAWDHMSLWRGAAWNHAKDFSFDPAHR